VDLFLSTYLVKVDRKGRVSVPATFRSTLETHRDPSAIIVFPSFKYRALDGAGSDRIEKMQERLEALDQFSDDWENLTMLFADAHRLPLDPEGRVVLPEDLKSFAGIGEEAAFVGLGAAFQIWEPGRFGDHRASIRERSLRQGSTLPPATPQRRQ
jgi:MraZ protein